MCLYYFISFLLFIVLLFGYNLIYTYNILLLIFPITSWISCLIIPAYQHGLNLVIGEQTLELSWILHIASTFRPYVITPAWSKTNYEHLYRCYFYTNPNKIGIIPFFWWIKLSLFVMCYKYVSQEIADAFLFSIMG